MEKARGTFKAMKATNYEHGSDSSDDEHPEGGGSRKVLYQIPSDVYGDMILTLVKLVDGAARGAHSMLSGKRSLWVVMSLVVYLLNMVMQVGLSFMLFSSTVEYKEDKYEVGLTEKIDLLKLALQSNQTLSDHPTHTMLTACLPEGQEGSLGNATLWESCQATVELCHANKAVVGAYDIVLLLWFARMVQEVFDAIWSVMVICQVPAPGDEEDSEGGAMLRRIPGATGGAAHTHVVALSPGVRSLVATVGTLPKVMIALWLSWLGAKFLVLAHDTGTVVLKALCLGYFVSIDELLFNSFISKRKKEEVGKASIVYWAPDSTDWDNWLSSVVRIILVVAAVLFVQGVVFHNIRSFRFICHDYKDAFPDPSAANAGLTNLFFL